MSDMNGTKSKYLGKFTKKHQLSFLTFDFRGHGKSSGQFIDYGIIDWVNDLKNMIKFLKIQNCILIGSSMGGWVAMYYSLLYPKNITKLIGIAAAPDFTTELIFKNLSLSEKNKIKNNIIVKKKVSQDFYYLYSPDLFRNSKLALLKNLKNTFKKEAIFFHGSMDHTVPYNYNERFLFNKNFINLKLITIKNADHGMSDKKSLDTISKFI